MPQQQNKVTTHLQVLLICVNIFIAGAGWGSLHGEVKALGDRITRLENHEDTNHYSEGSKCYHLGPPEASADTLKTTHPTIGERNVRHAKERPNVRR